MRKPLHKKGDMVIVLVMTNKDEMSKIPVEPDRHTDSFANEAPRCSVVEIKGEIIAVRSVQIDDKDPKYSYLIEFRYNKMSFGCLASYCYKAWLDEWNVHSSSTRR